MFGALFVRMVGAVLFFVIGQAMRGTRSGVDVGVAGRFIAFVVLC
jgi:hypothetical protein